MREELASLEALVAELLAGIQELLQSGERLSDEFQGMIADELEWATNRILEIQNEIQNVPAEGMAATTPPGPLPPGPFPSSNVNSFLYDPKSENLFVKFHGAKSAESGPTYQYGGIPRYIYDIFSRVAVGPKTSGKNRYHRWIKGVTPSLGGSLNALIKAGNFPYRRM